MTTSTPSGSSRAGLVAGLAAAGLFGVSTPFIKRLLPDVSVLALSSLLYLGAAIGVGIGVVVWPRETRGEARIQRSDLASLAVLIVLGGMAGPVLLLWGLERSSGTAGSLLLSFEAPLTVGVAVLFFREHASGRVLAALALVVAGGALLADAPGDGAGQLSGALAIIGACGCWAVDNNLTQRLSLRDPVSVVRAKALGAGSALGALWLITGRADPPSGTVVAAALGIGAVCYGLSLLLDVWALRLIGAAREATAFATAPFIGAALSIPLLDERMTTAVVLGAALMAAALLALAQERHEHDHVHTSLEHDHRHDAHHQHRHTSDTVREEHSHRHRHEALAHSHGHASDAHHRHRH